METKANHIVIGAFAIATILMTFLFVLWIGQIQLSREFTTYDLYFKGSVSGLSVASDVRYNGISVGDVKGIYLDVDDPNLVRVQIEVDAQAPVKIDTIAQMAFLGVTGVSFIELTGGTAQSEALLPKDGELHAVIEVKRSAIQELLETAPDIVAQSNLLLLQGAKLLSDENIERVSNTLRDLEIVVTAISKRDEEIGELIAHASATSGHLENMSGEIEELVSNTNAMMKGDVPLMLAEIISAAEGVDRLAVEANALLEDNKASISQFSSEGLGELSALLAEARLTIATMERLASEIEEDPTVLLGQAKYPEYEAN
jgi:phospholipid/cholesterol/gamma-HCH transport system substrate-binding protein